MGKKQTTSTSLTNEKKYFGLLLLILALVSCMFLISTILSAQMNYDSRRTHILSYFTVQSNILVSIWLFMIVLNIFTNRKIYGISLNINFSASITTYILVTGIVFWTILVPIFYRNGETWMFSITNIWLHTISPVLSVILFKYVKSLQTENNPRPKLLFFFIYPAFYIVFGIVNALNEIYLYPMFNPAYLGGWIGVAGCMLVMVIIFTGLYLSLIYGVNRNKTSE